MGETIEVHSIKTKNGREGEKLWEIETTITVSGDIVAALEAAFPKQTWPHIADMVGEKVTKQG